MIVTLGPKRPRQRTTAIGFIIGVDVIKASTGPKYAPE